MTPTSGAAATSLGAAAHGVRRQVHEGDEQHDRQQQAARVEAQVGRRAQAGEQRDRVAVSGRGSGPDQQGARGQHDGADGREDEVRLAPAVAVDERQRRAGRRAACRARCRTPRCRPRGCASAEPARRRRPPAARSCRRPPARRRDRAPGRPARARGREVSSRPSPMRRAPTSTTRRGPKRSTAGPESAPSANRQCGRGEDAGRGPPAGAERVAHREQERPEAVGDAEGREHRDERRHHDPPGRGRPPARAPPVRTAHGRSRAPAHGRATGRGTHRPASRRWRSCRTSRRR